MNAVGRLARSSIRSHKLRSGVICAAVILTSVLFMTVISIISNIFTGAQLMLMLASGTDFHATIAADGLKVPPDELLEQVKADKTVSEAYILSVLGASESETDNLKIDHMYGLSSEKALGHLFITVTDGRFPSEPNEIALCSALYPEVKTGQTLTLNFSNIIESGGVLTQSEYSRDYTVTALYTSEADSAIPALTIYDAGGENAKTIIYVRFYNSINLNGKTLALTDSLSDVAPSGELNADMNAAFFSSNTTPLNFATVFTVVISVAIVFFCAFLLIYNIYSIALTQDMRAYGLLGMIGATYKQLRSLIRTQALLLFALSAPVGITAGYFIGWKLLAPVFMTMSDQNMKYRFNVWIIVASAALTLFTLLYSALRPMKRLKKLTPVEAVNDNGRIKAKTKKKPSEVGPVRLGIGFALGNPRRLTVTALSAALSVTLVMLVSALTGMVRDIGVGELSLTDITLKAGIEYEIMSGDTGGTKTVKSNPSLNSGKCALPSELYEKLLTLDGAGEVYAIRFVNTEVAATEQNQSDAAEIIGRIPDGMLNLYGGENLRLISDGRIPAIFIGVPDELCGYIEMGDGLCYDGGELYDGAHVIAADNLNIYYVEGDDGSSELTLPELFSDGGTVASDSLSRVYTVIKSDLPYSSNILRALTGDILWDYGAELFILPESVFKAEFGEGEIYSILCSYAGNGEHTSTGLADGEKDFKERVEAVAALYTARQDGFTSFIRASGRYDGLEQLETRLFAIQATGYSLCAMIFLIGLINIVNSSLSSVAERRREYAMLEAVGMTGRQQRVMLLTDDSIGGVLSAAAALLAGAPLITLSISAMSGESIKTDLLPSLIMLAALFAVSVLTSLVSYSILRRSPLTDRIRQE